MVFNARAARTCLCVWVKKLLGGRSTEQSVTAYLQRKSSYCGPCLVHDPPRMIVLLISALNRTDMLLPTISSEFRLQKFTSVPEVCVNAFKIKYSKQNGI